MRTSSKRGVQYWTKQRARLMADRCIQLTPNIVINPVMGVELMDKKIKAYAWMKANNVKLLA